MSYSVYILQSQSSGRYYVGMTEDVARRLNDHNRGKTTSTRNRGPWRIIFTDPAKSRQDAWRRERQIKSYKHGDAFRKLIAGGVA